MSSGPLIPKPERLRVFVERLLATSGEDAKRFIDNASDVDGHPDVTSYRSRKHETLIRTNGAFEIRDAKTKEVLVAKLGSDGKGVWS